VESSHSAKPSLLAESSLSAKPSLSTKPSPSTKPSFSAKYSLSEKPSLSVKPSLSTEPLNSSDISRYIYYVIIHNDEIKTHEYVNEDPKPLIETSQHDKYPRKSTLSRSQSSYTISIDEFTEPSVILDNQLELLAICDNESEILYCKDQQRSSECSFT